MCMGTSIVVGSLIGAAVGAAAGAATKDKNNIWKFGLGGLALGGLGGWALAPAGAAAGTTGSAVTGVAAGTTASAEAGSAASVLAAGEAGAMGLNGAAGASTIAEAAEVGAVSTATASEATGAAGLTAAEKAALGVAGLGVVGSGGSQIMAAKAEADALKDQAKADKVRAGQAQDEGREEAIDAARRARQDLGRGRAQLAASGVMMDGAPTQVPAMYETDIAVERAYDQAKIMQNANLRAWGYNTSASLGRRSAYGRMRAGYVASASSALSSGVGLYGATKGLMS